MSVIVKDESGQILLLCKGADRFASDSSFCFTLTFDASLDVISETNYTVSFSIDFQRMGDCMRRIQASI